MSNFLNSGSTVFTQAFLIAPSINLPSEPSIMSEANCSHEISVHIKNLCNMYYVCIGHFKCFKSKIYKMNYLCNNVYGKKSHEKKLKMRFYSAYWKTSTWLVEAWDENGSWKTAGLKTLLDSLYSKPWRQASIPKFYRTPCFAL